MIKKVNPFELILVTFIAIGVCISFVNFFNFRSLWIDEARLALNIVNKSTIELLKPLEMNQVAPVGFLVTEKLFCSLFGYKDWVFVYLTPNSSGLTNFVNDVGFLDYLIWMINCEKFRLDGKVEGRSGQVR